MTQTACVLLLTLIPMLSFAADGPSALRALKVIPKDEVKNLARIEAQGGTPVPDRWHFLVHHPDSENGLKEYVVASGELVAAREISQFAENLTEEDVIGGTSVKIDTDKLADLAKKYAAVNEVEVATINYQLIRIGEEAQPIWRLDCVDSAGSINASLVVTATKGVVVSQDGFPVTPKSIADGKVKKTALRFETESAELVAADEEWSLEDEEPEEAEKPTPAVAAASKKTTASSPKKKAVSRSSRSSSRHTASRRSARVPRPGAVVRRVTSPVRKVVRRILPF